MRSPGRVAAGGLPAAALVFVAACSAGGGGTPGSVAGDGPGGSAPASGTAGGSPGARRALLTAAAQTGRLSSAAETLTVRVSGTQSETTTGIILAQLRPAVQISADLSLTRGGQRSRVKEVLTGGALYFHISSLARQFGKPWVKINPSRLQGSAGALFTQMFRSLQTNTFTEQARLLSVARNTHAAGRQMIHGVPTTEYAGSLGAAAALKSLPAGARKVFSAELQALGNSTISFRAWIDGQHHTLRMAETEKVNGETVRTTLDITALNQPVDITVPPAGQTTTQPGF